MVAALFTAVDTASAVLTLSKVAWKLGSSLSRLDQDTKYGDNTVRNLVEEIKSLGTECDIIYAELEELLSKSDSRLPLPYDVDDRTWNCLATQVEETSLTLHELELFVKIVAGEESSLNGQTQRQRKLDTSRDQIASVRAKVCRHTEKLRTTLFLITTVLAHIAPSRSDRSLSQELIKLHDMVEKLQRSADAQPQSRSSHTEAALMQYAREVIANGTSRCTASLTAQSAAGGQGLEGANMRAGGWMSGLGSIRRDQQLSNPPDIDPKITPMLSRHQSHTSSGSTISTQRAMQERVAVGSVWDESDDDLDADLAKAALETGTKAFEAQDWEEAESLLQEALRVLRQLPKQQRAFCDTFDLQYKLAVCAYRTQEPAVAEEALMSLVQQSASSDEHRGYIYAGTHLLAQLYIRMGQVDRARTECERALQARRRLLGKQSDASLESTALMAHIYNLLNNHARAKSCLAMIPEARRDNIIKMVEVSLGKKMEHLDSPPLLSRSISGDSDVSINQTQSRLIASSLATSMEHRRQGPVSANILPSPGVELWQSHQRNPSMEVDFEKRHSATVTSFSSAEDRSEPRAMAKELGGGTYSTDPEVFVAAALSPSEQPGGNENSIGKTLSRKEILHKIGCQPKDPIEEAVCDGDNSAFTSLLNKKNGFWRSKLRKQLRPERVTALHFAALFGEIDMARRLLGAGFKINEVPYGYSTSLTPLKFAIGARQAGMVEFLIVNGAKPSEPDSWATLAGQLMNRSWLTKTMSESDKEQVPHKILAILRILLKHGWDVNAPFETSGATVLHQAVTFWTGSYRWDLKLRAAITSFLCEQGADPFHANTEGKTPYDLASASGHQDLLLILDRGSKRVGTFRSAEPVELSAAHATFGQGKAVSFELESRSLSVEGDPS